MTLQHGFDVIDVHQHLETGIGMKAALDFGLDTHETGEDLEFTTRSRVMDDLNIRGAIIIAGGMYLRPNGLADTREVNNKIAAYRDRTPARILGGVGIVEPLYGPAGFDEVRRCKEELNLIGIGFHNGQQGVPIDSPLMLKLIEKIGAAGLTPFIHAVGDHLETIWQVDSLAAHFPDLNMIILDAFRDISQIRSLGQIAARRPNLYFDLSLLLSFELMGLPQVRAIGADRFVFGTNFYSWPSMTTPIGRPLEQILESDLADDAKAAILGQNAIRVLGLPVAQPAGRPGSQRGSLAPTR